MNIIISFPNGEGFSLPAEFVALERTKYYAEKDGFEKGSKEWEEELKQSLNPNELYDWIGNNMEWDDIKDKVTKLEPEEPDYDEMWCEAEFFVK